MEFRLLGPVEVLAEGAAPVPLRRRERGLLAVLLLDAGQVVTVDRLVGLLWDDDPPARARTAIHSHVSRIRSALRAADGRPGSADRPGGPRLLTRGTGYLLEVDPARVDVHRFRALVDRARAADDPARRAELLRAGLDLWRGPALADAATDALRRRVCAGLEEQRMVALEDRIDADLGAGRHAALVVELSRLVDDHPARERLWGQLVVALHRCDRWADASAAHRRARYALGEEGPARHHLERLVRADAQALADTDTDTGSVAVKPGGPPAVAEPAATAPTEFRLLGPIEVRDGDRTVPVDARRARAVLAALALNAGRRVSVERLVEVAWGDDPPATVEQQVFNGISALRKAVGDVVVTKAGGYLLRVDPRQVDVNAFEAGVAEARRDAAGGHLETAVDRIRAALSLWRGPALDGIPGLAADAQRLAELRLAAVEDCLELELALSRHAEVVPELYGLVTEQPLRERLVGQLMLALYRCGRSAEALEVYRLTQERLADLGMDPGRELRQLEVAILRTDAALDVPKPAVPTPAAAAVPAQLPAGTAGFTGRDEHLRQLDALLTDQDESPAPAVVVTVIAGTAGVGKTALAVHWAHGVSSRFADGQLFVNLRGYAAAPPMRPIEALAQFLRALGVPAERIPVDTDEAAGLYRSLLAGKRVLVVLDNASDPDQVRPLLPGSATCLVVVTSRDRLGGLVARDGALLLRLDALTPGEAHTLLAYAAGADRVRAEPDAAAKLTELCAHLPLALRIAAANLVSHPHDRIADHAAELATGDRLTALQLDGDTGAAVRAAFDQSYARLEPAAQRLFRSLSLVPGPDVTAAAAAAVADTTPRQAGRLLDTLAAAHLVSQNGSGRFGFHDLLRLYAGEWSTSQDTADERAAAVERLLGWYVRSVDAAMRALGSAKIRLPVPPLAPEPPPASFDDHAAALAWLDTERSNLLAAAEFAAAAGPRPMAWLLADAMRAYFWLRRHGLDWLRTAEAGLAAARADGDRRAEAAAHLCLADAMWSLGRYADAADQYERVAALGRRTGWREIEAAGVGGTGSMYREVGRLHDGARQHEAALAIARELGRRPSQAVQLMNLGSAHWDLGRLARAADFYGQALVIYRDVADSQGAANTLGNLGGVHHEMGLFGTAREELTGALATFRDIGDRYGQAVVLDTLARLDRDVGRRAEGLDLVRAALAVAAQTGDRRAEADALNTAGTIHLRVGQPRRAVEDHWRALHLSRQTNLGRPRIEALVGLADAYRCLGALGPARAHASEAVAVAGRIGFRALEGTGHTLLAAVWLAEGRAEAALDHARQALDLHRATGHRQGEAGALLVLGRVLDHTGDADAAAAHWRDALAILTGIGAAGGDEVRALLDVRQAG